MCDLSVGRTKRSMHVKLSVFVTFTSSLRLLHASPREVEVFLMARWHLSYRSFLCRVNSVCNVCVCTGRFFAV